jgi:hypothetical protein
VGTGIISLPHDRARLRLRRLDYLLDQLEELNLRDEEQVSPPVAYALETEGVKDPYVFSVTDLINRVFDIQEPLLALIRDRSRRWRLHRAEAPDR